MSAGTLDKDFPDFYQNYPSLSLVSLSSNRSLSFISSKYVLSVLERRPILAGFLRSSRIPHHGPRRIHQFQQSDGPPMEFFLPSSFGTRLLIDWQRRSRGRLTLMVASAHQEPLESSTSYGPRTPTPPDPPRSAPAYRGRDSQSLEGLADGFQPRS